MPEVVKIGPYSITSDLPDPSSFVPRPSSLVINTINTHAWVVAEKDPLFREALISSDVLLPDGEGIVWAVKHVTGKNIKKIAGYDIFIYLLEYLQKTSGTCFFMGAAQDTLDLIKARLAKEYPNITAGFYSPPFKQEFSEEDNFVIHDKIRSQLTTSPPHHLTTSPPHHLTTSPPHHLTTSPPHHLTTLFVGLTAPKQEKWVFQNKDRIDADIVCSIGAVFDFYAGTVQRPPDWMIGMKLEWFGRLLKDPKRIWKRVFLSTPRFVRSILTLHK